MRVKAQVRFTALKEEQIKFCISVSVINANRVFLYYEDGSPPGGYKDPPLPGPYRSRQPKKNLRFSLETLPCVPPSSDGCCSLVEKCTDSSTLWVLLLLLTPGAGVFSAFGGESDQTGYTLSLHGCAVRISTGCTLSFRGQRCMKNV